MQLYVVLQNISGFPVWVVTPDDSLEEVPLGPHVSVTVCQFVRELFCVTQCTRAGTIHF